MVNKKHQGEKLYLDNLYYEDIFNEDDVIPIEDGGVCYISFKGVWKKLHPLDIPIDKNNVHHLIDNQRFKSETNEFDDRNLSWKEIQFRI